MVRLPMARFGVLASSMWAWDEVEATHGFLVRFTGQNYR